MIPQNALEGKVALVTGAGRGIGRAIALILAEYGAKVALVARSADQLEKTQQKISEKDHDTRSFPTDLRDEKQAVSLVSRVIEHFGRLDILVNNAGIGVFRPLVETETAQWDEVFAVNARAPFLLCREAIPHLRQHERSFIINITSVVGRKGYINQALYSASKHAMMGMTKALAKEVQPDGIRVHAICPGGVDTKLTERGRPDLDRTVLMSPREVAEIVLFLATRHGNAVIDEVDVRRESSAPWA